MRNRIIILFASVIFCILITTNVLALTTTLTPNANGTYMGWAIRAGTGDRWQLQTDNLNTSYLRTTDSNNAVNETVALSNLPANAFSVQQVDAYMTASAQGGGAGERLFLKMYDGTAWWEAPGANH